MANFFQPPPEVSVPVSIDDSRGFRRDNSFRDLFRDVSSTIQKSVGALDDVLAIQAEEAANEAVSALDEQHLAASEANVLEEAPSAPRGLTAALDEMQNLAKGLDQNTISSTQQGVEMRQRIREVKRRFPGHTKQIEAGIRSALGRPGASSRRSAVAAQQRQMNTLKNIEIRNLNATLKRLAKTGDLPEWYQNATNEQLTLYENEVNRKRQTIKDAKAEIELTGKLEERAARNAAARYVSQSGAVALVALNGNDSAQSRQKVLEQLRGFAASGKVDPETLEGIGQQIRSLRVAADRTLEDLQQPDDKGRSIWNQMSSEDQKIIRSQLYGPIDSMQKAIFNDQDVSQVGITASVMNARVNAIKHEMFRRNDTQQLLFAAVAEKMPSQVKDEMLTQFRNSEKFDSTAADIDYVELFQSSRSVRDSVQRAQQDSPSGQVSGTLLKEFVDNRGSVLTSQHMPKEFKLRAARSMFSPGSELELAQMEHRHRLQVLELMASPEIREAVFALGDERLNDDFTQFVLKNFGNTLRVEIGELANATEVVAGIDIVYKMNEAQFVAAPTGASPQLGAADLTPGLAGVTAGFKEALEGFRTSQTGQALDKVNRYLRVAKPILKNSGASDEEVASTLLDQMQALNINPTPNGEDTAFSKVLDALFGGGRAESQGEGVAVADEDTNLALDEEEPARGTFDTLDEDTDLFGSVLSGDTPIPMPRPEDLVKEVNENSETHGSLPPGSRASTRGHPLIGSLSGASSLTRKNAVEVQTKMLEENWTPLVAEFLAATGKELIVNDAIAKAGTSRERKRRGSMHFKGHALDVSVANLTGEEAVLLSEMARKHGFTGHGYGRGILHLDKGAKRAWGYSRGNTNPFGRSGLTAAEMKKRHLAAN